MQQDPLELECDRLSETVDNFLYQRIRWDRVEGPMLAKLSQLANATFEGRPDFELAEEGATNDLRRFVLKVHSNRVVAIKMWLENGRALLDIEQIERSKYLVAASDPLSAAFDGVDEAWMAQAMQTALARVHKPEA